MLSAELQKRGQQLLDYQCWVWGKDIKYEGGNLLLEYGFSQSRSNSCEGKPMTQYDLYTMGFVFSIWGFGLYVGDLKDGVFIHRSGFRITEAIGEVRLMTKGEQDKYYKDVDNLFLLYMACDVIHLYEDWLAKRVCSLSYRRGCFNDFPRERDERIMDNLAGEWWKFKQEVQKCLHT